MIGHELVDCFLYGLVFFAFSWIAEDTESAPKILKKMSRCQKRNPKDSCDHLRLPDSLKFQPQFRCSFIVSVLVILRDHVVRSSKVGSNTLHDHPSSVRIEPNEKAPIHLRQFSNLCSNGLPLGTIQAAELFKFE